MRGRSLPTMETTLCADRERPPLYFVARALLWGACWGVGVGAVEATWHLTHWQLFTTNAGAACFFTRSVLYGVVYFAASAAVLASVCLGSAWVRQWVLQDRHTGGNQLLIGALATSTVALYGVVTWRVGYHINDPWSSPALLGGIVAALIAAVGIGAAVVYCAAPLARRFPRLWVWPLPLCLLFVVVLPGGRTPDSDTEHPRRVLLITLDTFRADRIGAAGGLVETPVLDRIAQRGVMFEQAVAQAPITCPAHLSILGSAAPTSHGVFANGTRIPGDLPLLQESFGAEGIPTAAFVAGYPVTSRFGFDRGFDVFDDDFGDGFGDHRLTVRRLVDQVVYSRGAPRERIADAVVERARPWLEAHAKGEFFCWVHFFDPHGPYVAPAPFGESLAGPMPEPTDGPEMPQYWPAVQRRVAVPEYWKKRYDEEVAYTDDRLGRLLQILDDAGVLEETVVAVVADHGESLDEHDYYFEHGLYLYDASLRVPMLIAGPGLPQGERVTCQVRGMDLAPTVLDLVNVPTPRSFEGESLQGLWVRGCPEEGVRYSVAATVEPPWLDSPGAELALRTDGTMRFKYVKHRRSEDELYDLIADPDETQDQFGQQADLERFMLDYLLRVSEGMSDEAPAIPDDVEAQLRALGYIVDAPAPPSIDPHGSAPGGGDDDSAGDRGTP